MTVPTGWYDQGDGTQRYWDGIAWTEHTAPASPTRTPAGGQFATTLAAPPLAQPSGYAALPSAAPAAAPRKRVWPWVLGIVGGVLLLIIGLAVWGVMAFVGVVKGPVDTVNDFENAVESGDCSAMEATVTSSLLASSGWEDCEVFKSDAESLSPSAFNANNSSIVNGAATVTAEIRYTGDTAAYVGTYTLIKQGGDWRVDAFSIEVKGS